MKKKKILIGIGIAIIVIAIIAVTAYFILNNKPKKNYSKDDEGYADLINENSDLPVEYLSKYDYYNPFLKNCERIGNFMSADYRDDNIFISYYGYPNDESDYYLGEIKLFTDKYNILGVTIGDDYYKAVSKIKQYGFTGDEEVSEYGITLEFGKLTIRIESNYYPRKGIVDNLVVSKFDLKIDSEYLGNRLY